MNIYQKYNENPVPLFVHVILCAIAIAFWLLVTSVILPFLFVFQVFKWAVAAWILYYRFGQLLASEDVPFMHESERNGNYNVSLFMLKGKADIEKMKRLFLERVLKNEGHVSYKRLQQSVRRKCGRYVWTKEVNFDLSRHVVLYEGPYPADEEELPTLFGEILSKPLPNDISPWETVLIPLKGKDRCAFLTRAHHIIGDGISMVNLFSKLMDNKPVFLRPNEKSIKEYRNSALKRLIHGIFTGPLTLLTLLVSSAKSPFPKKAGVKAEQKVAWTQPISLPKIKQVKNKLGATINDVAMGCLAGAIRRFLISTQGKCTEDVQISISINTRPPALLLEENLPLENNSTGMLLNLPTTAETILERVKESKKRMDVIKKSSTFLVFGFIFNIVVARLPEFLARMTVNALNTHSCLIMSNVPGPMNKMVIEGDEVESIMVWPPLIGGTAISMCVFSYADTMRLNVKADTSFCSNPKLLADCFKMETDELFKLFAEKDN